MTLLDIRNQIISCLLAKDTFSLEDDLAGVQMKLKDEGSNDLSKDLVKTALAELEEIGMVRRIEDREMWILSGPLNVGGQDVHISMELANGIAEVVNSFLKANGEENNLSDPLAIHSGDLQFLLKIIGDLME